MFWEKMKSSRYVLLMSVLLTSAVFLVLTGCGKDDKTENDKNKAGKESLMPYFSAEPTSAVLNLEYTYVEFGRYPQTELAQKDIDDNVINADYDENNNAELNDAEKVFIHREKSGEEYKYYYIEPVKWRIIDVTDTEVMLWSDKVIDAYTFSDEEKEKYVWSSSELREWLNEAFYDMAFSDEEKNQIQLRNYTNYESAFMYPMREEDKPELVTDHTDDRVGIRSSYELNAFQYECPYRLVNDEEKELYPDMELYLKCESSDYALENYKNKASFDRAFYEGNIGGYWTRTVIDNSDFAVFVDFMGTRVSLTEIEDNDYMSNSVHNVLGVRPIIVLPLEGIDRYVVD